MSLMPDPTFYPSPGMAMKATPEHIAYVSLLNVGKNGKRDAMGVIDVDPHSPTYGQLVGLVDFPGNDNELHHFGWNASSLPDRSGYRIVPDSHPGYESGSQPSRDRESDRARRVH